jgi:hypothetical protein
VSEDEGALDSNDPTRQHASPHVPVKQTSIAMIAGFAGGFAMHWFAQLFICPPDARHSRWHAQ